MRWFNPSMLILLPRLHFCGVSLAASRRPHIARSLRRLRTARFASSHIKGVFDVSAGGNGYVSLSVVQPKSPSPVPAHVIIRLPQGPLFQDLPKTEDNSSAQNDGLETLPIVRITDDAVSAQALADMTSSTMVTINYRLGELPFDENQIPIQTRVGSKAHPQSLHYQYPTPVHDTLTGLDWVLRNLQPKRLGIIGTHIGGSLALMLALTEPRSVHAVAALEPICDWTSLDEYCTVPSRPRRKQHAPTDLVPLLEARGKFFATHDRYFDPFASPILFLRSAGKNVPKLSPKYLTGPDHPVPVLVTDEPEETHELWDAYIPDETIHDEKWGSITHNSYPNSTGDDNQPTRRRKALCRWPPYGLDYGITGPPGRYSRQPVERLEVSLPWVRLFTHHHAKQKTSIPISKESETPEQKPSPTRKRTQRTTVLSHQAAEMVDVMRRACFWGKEKGFGENRVTLSSISESCSCESKPRPTEITSTSLAGEWLAETLKSDANINT